MHTFVLGSKYGVAEGQDIMHVFVAGSYARAVDGHALQTFVNAFVTGVGPEQATVHVVPPPEL